MTSKSTTRLRKPSKPLKTDWKPHAYQRQAMKFMLENSCAGLFLDPGLGKTSITLGTIKALKRAGKFNKALIIAPLRVCYSVWPKEQEKWTDFEDISGVILHGDRKDWNLQQDFDVYLINPEGLTWLFGQKLKEFKAAGFDVLVIDESSKFKDPQTKRFKAMRPHLGRFKRRYILTGTPAPNGLMDLFGQIYILDLGAALGQFITHFRSRFFYQTGFGGYDWKLQPGADKLIHNAIRPLTLRMDADELLDMPELIVNPIYLELDDKSQRIYDDMERDLLAAIESGDVEASTAAVASSKCAQIANGGIYDEDGKPHFIHDIKTEVVSEILDELGGNPALVAYEYGHDLERLRARLGKDLPYIGGGISPKRSDAIADQWNRGDLPYLAVQPASVAHGLNLQQSGNHIILHSLIWNYEYYDQLIRRLRRQGSKHKRIFAHQLIMRGTVDELKIMALNNKFRTQDSLFKALRAFLQGKRRP